MVNKEFDLIRVIDQCIDSLTLQSKQAGVELMRPEVDDPLVETCFRALISDEHRYRQIIFNFLSNSLKFTPQGGKVTVSLESTSFESFFWDEERTLNFKMIISDTGAGISEEGQARLFKNFGKL